MIEILDWDEIPDVINKEQLRRLCHISKRTALFLLQSGKIPCTNTGKKTRCYSIRKDDVQAYLKARNEYPEAFAAPAGWYGKRSTGTSKSISEEMSIALQDYFTRILSPFPDVITAQDICNLTGYKKTTINKWCKEDKIVHLMRHCRYYIPKKQLPTFFASDNFRLISKKTTWHKKVMREFYKEFKQKHTQ